MGVAEPRYARALYRQIAASEPAEVKPSADCLDTLAEYFTENESVARFMSNPLIPIKARKGAALNLLPENAPEGLKRLVSVMADRKRLPLLPGVAAAYRKLLTDNGAMLYVRVSSAYPLDEEQTGRIGEAFARKHKAKAFTVIIAVDETLLGGVRVQVGDTVSDGTLKMKLLKLKELMR